MSSWGESYDRRVSLASRVAIEVDVEEFVRGNAQVLRDYWAYGKGADRINWQETEGNLTRCHDLVVKYMPDEDDAWGYCERRHEDVFGESNRANDARREREKE